MVVHAYERLGESVYRIVRACSALSVESVEVAARCISVVHAGVGDEVRSEAVVDALRDGMCSGADEQCACFFDEQSGASVCEGCRGASPVFAKTVGPWCDDAAQTRSWSEGVSR